MSSRLMLAAGSISFAFVLYAVGVFRERTSAALRGRRHVR